jgi:tripartite-type tricarboxylate transporter receptor subunit TctC
MPEPVLAKLHDAFKRSMADSNFTNSMERLGCLVIYRGPQELKEYVQRMVHEEGELIHKLGLRK